MIHLVIPGEPKAQGRARFSARHGYPRAYDPKSSADYKKYIITIANQITCRPLQGPLVMKVDIFRGIPKSWPKKKQEQALSGIIKPIIKPDCSNYLKGIEDALNGIAYMDDSQIVLVHVTKQYAAEPRAEIRVWQDDDELNDKYINGRGNG